MFSRNRKFVATGIAIAAIITSALLLGIQYTGHVSESERHVTIGVPLPLSGSLSQFGEWAKNGIEMARDDINQNNSLKVSLVFEDTRCLPQDASSALNKLINIDNVPAYVGPFCTSFLAAEISEQNRIVGVSPSHNYGKISDYFFSSSYFLEEEPRTMAGFAYNELGLRRIAIIYFNNDWGKVHQETFKEEFERLGGEITIMEAISTFGQSDFRTELTKIKNTHPDGLFIAYSVAGNIINQAKELGLDVQFLGQWGIERPDFLAVAGENADGLYYTYRDVDDEEKTHGQKGFLARYQDRYGERPGVVAAEGYDSMIILYKAISACEATNFDPDCLRDKISHTKNYKGASGDFSIDPETYEVSKPVFIKTVRNRRFEYLE